MQFLLSKYVMPAAASRHIETNWRTVKVLELFLKNDNKDPPASTEKHLSYYEKHFAGQYPNSRDVFWRARKGQEDLRYEFWMGFKKKQLNRQ